MKQHIRYALIVIFILFLAGILISWLSTASSVATAPSRVINKTLETNNIIHNYEWFYDVNASFTARANQVAQFKSLWQTEQDQEEKRHLRIEMAAMQQTCRQLAEQYNANSQKMNTSIFKGWSLPKSLNINTCE